MTNTRSGIRKGDLVEWFVEGELRRGVVVRFSRKDCIRPLCYIAPNGQSGPGQVVGVDLAAVRLAQGGVKGGSK